MKIIDININDFGGKDDHREEFKNEYGIYKYLKEWDKLDKTIYIKGIFEYISKNDPDIVVLQEYDINAKDVQVFYNEMTKKGYLLKTETPTNGRPSLTAMYIKESIDFEEIPVGHERNLRAYAIKTEDIIIYGTHIPPKYDNNFWDELHAFVKKNSLEKYILIGDFNTINYKNNNRLKSLLDNAVDVWKEKGNNELLSIAGDHVIASKNIEVNNFEIEKIETSYTDHPIILVTLLNN